MENRKDISWQYDIKLDIWNVNTDGWEEVEESQLDLIPFPYEN